MLHAGSEAPNDLVAEYYRQRTSQGGLIVTECNHVSAAARGYVRAPGLYTPEQVAGWKKVVDAVHGGGGLIYLQLFHPGEKRGGEETGGACNELIKCMQCICTYAACECAHRLYGNS